MRFAPSGFATGKSRRSPRSLSRGRQTIDAKGLVVAPGFIDLHQHGQEERNYEFQAHDGVTTSLELEVGTDDVPKWYAERADRSLINYGVSVGHIPVRMTVLHDPGKWLPTGDAANRPATVEEHAEILRRMEAGLQAGAVSVGMGINYTPGCHPPGDRRRLQSRRQVWGVGARSHSLCGQ